MNQDGRRYQCCEHCADDVIHDVVPDGHDLPCDMLIGPWQFCEQGRKVAS